MNCLPGEDDAPLPLDDTSMASGPEDPKMIVESLEELPLGGGLAVMVDELEDTMVVDPDP